MAPPEVPQIPADCCWRPIGPNTDGLSDDVPIAWVKGMPYRLDKLAGGVAAGEALDAIAGEGGEA